MKKQTYRRPEIWAEELSIESSLLGVSREVTSTDGNGGFVYRGGGSGPARAGENLLWDEEDEDSAWDQL